MSGRERVRRPRVSKYAAAKEAARAAILADPCVPTDDLVRAYGLTKVLVCAVRRQLAADGLIAIANARAGGSQGRDAMHVSDSLNEFMAREPDASVVYFVGADTGPIKVGFSKDLDTRLAGLQANCPVALRVYGLVRGTRQHEYRLHYRLADLRAHGEWFEREAVREAFFDFVTAHPERVVQSWDGPVVARPPKAARRTGAPRSVAQLSLLPSRGAR